MVPKKAEIHIQNTAPGPPAAMAVATPAIFPVPSVAARAVQADWKPVIPPVPGCLPFSCPESEAPSVERHHKGRCRSWKKPVPTLKISPAAASRRRVAGPQANRLSRELHQPSQPVKCSAIKFPIPYSFLLFAIIICADLTNAEHKTGKKAAGGL